MKSMTLFIVLAFAAAAVCLLAILWYCVGPMRYRPLNMKSLVEAVSTAEPELSLIIDHADQAGSSRVELGKVGEGLSVEEARLDSFGNAFLIVRGTMFRTVGLVRKGWGYWPIESDPWGQRVLVLKPVVGKWYYYEGS